jgi:hypothetical protein
LILQSFIQETRMPAPTLQAIEAKFSEIGAMIAALKQTSAPTTYTLRAAQISLAPGEQYAGLLLSDDGWPKHHLVLLPDRAEEITWTDAVQWAKNEGGELPSRREQALLFANLKDQFEAAWYWSSESHEKDGSSAWTQTFDFGTQYYTRKSYEGRARAVRRVAA